MTNYHVFIDINGNLHVADLISIGNKNYWVFESGTPDSSYEWLGEL